MADDMKCFQCFASGWLRSVRDAVRLLDILLILPLVSTTQGFQRFSRIFEEDTTKLVVIKMPFVRGASLG